MRSGWSDFAAGFLKRFTKCRLGILACRSQFLGVLALRILMNVLTPSTLSYPAPPVFEKGEPASADFCWVADHPPGRNQFVSFDLDVSYSGQPETVLHLFADTRYRLFINDRFVAYGPARFVTQFPEYDSFDLTELLLVGENRLRVEVNFYGSSSFQTMPDGKPAFYAAGGLGPGRSDFSTPGNWRARIHRAWKEDAPAFSFAQGPAEICDTRVLADELQKPAMLPARLETAQNFRFTPKRRSTGVPDFSPTRPRTVTVSAPLKDSRRWGVQLRTPPETRPHRAFATWVYSPGNQRVTMDGFWMETWINGQQVKLVESGKRGNHCEAVVFLREGWNFLSGHLVQLGTSWPLLLGFPVKAALSLHPFPDRETREGFVVSAPLSHGGPLPRPETPSDFRLPEGWKEMPSNLADVTPARLCAWDEPAGTSEETPYGKHCVRHASSAAIWSFAFSEEYYGHPVLEVEAPPGSVLDVAYDDWKRADGCVHLYNANHFTDAADRFVLRGGFQRIHVLNPRGGRFLQVILRAPENSGSSSLAVTKVEILRRTQVNRGGSFFRCGNDVLDWAWDASVRTLECSADEAYTDTPWRERATYIGDVLVSLHLHGLVSADLSIARRSLQLFAQARLTGGQLPCCAPSWLRRPHEDYTLLWLVALRDYWALTGDLSLAREEWDVAEGILSGSSWQNGRGDLWNATGTNLFVDWGVIPEERKGEGNAVLNIFRVAALRAVADLAEGLGKSGRADALRLEGVRISAAVEKLLWNERAGRFLASVGAATPALHANVLALRFGVGPASRILGYLEPLLRDNLRRGLVEGRRAGYVELYFFFFLIPALANCGRHDLAEELLLEHYGYIRSFGLNTLPEEFLGVDKGKHSCCHSWSGAPAIYGTERILGLTRPVPGDPDRFFLAPESRRHNFAEGRLQHIRGDIWIRWKRRGREIFADASVPPGVTLEAGPGVTLSVVLA